MAGAPHAAATRQGAQWSAQLELQAEKFIAGATLRRLGARATGEFRLSRNLSVALGAGRTWAPRHVSELNVSLKWRQRSLANPLERD
ncbi:hypothetical protein PO883_18915 [Massilia sp. DJPM01]|uniref:hypothetical protein n=1 Tax=Massilia sp. DJPM01 TaxID=3024404 RepID=UPI00259F1CF6|nr:hypothetical protein [Massilia sp. DJPM01]MDM5179267.1 hypothetical protein [Massilia sp. DJPM01]